MDLQHRSYTEWGEKSKWGITWYIKAYFTFIFPSKSLGNSYSLEMLTYLKDKDFEYIKDMYSAFLCYLADGSYAPYKKVLLLFSVSNWMDGVRHRCSVSACDLHSVDIWPVSKMWMYSLSLFMIYDFNLKL